jgi:hypothetical protein
VFIISRSVIKIIQCWHFVICISGHLKIILVITPHPSPLSALSRRLWFPSRQTSSLD